MNVRRIYSNGPSKDFVINPFRDMANKCSRIHIAAPYVTETSELLQAAKAGKTVDLLVGLNESTSPQALDGLIGSQNISVRYLTHRFHAKIFLFDDHALVGSSNLTDGGLVSNREATIFLGRPEDVDTVEELRALFMELWDSALVLTPEKLKAFRDALKLAQRVGPDPDVVIEKAVGKAEPVNINIASANKSPHRLFLEELRRQVHEQYRPAFNEVTKLLQEKQFRRKELENVGPANETNRFLNWVRLTYVPGDESWQTAPLRSQEDRRAEVFRLGEEWTSTEESRIPPDYIDWLRMVQLIFGSEESLRIADQEQMTRGLTSLHAFSEQQRFVKGGAQNLPKAFWAANNEDVVRVRRTLHYLIFGPSDFIQRLHDVLYNPQMKLAYFGRFCALELYGTIKPEDCPPMNGRMAKALRYLGFDVRGA